MDAETRSARRVWGGAGAYTLRQAQGEWGAGFGPIDSGATLRQAQGERGGQPIPPREIGAFGSPRILERFPI